MAAPWAKRFYHSKRWRAVRESFGESRFWLCEKCGEPGEIVHHSKVWLTRKNIDDANVTLGTWNLELLCRDCHNKVHGRGHRVTRDGFYFDAEGNLRAEEPRG